MLNGVKSIGENNALIRALTSPGDAFHPQCAYPISETSLEYRSILLGPFLSDGSMIGTQLKQIAKKRNARNLGEILDLGSVRRIEVSNNQEDEKSSYTENYRRSHIETRER